MRWNSNSVKGQVFEYPNKRENPTDNMVKSDMTTQIGGGTHPACAEHTVRVAGGSETRRPYAASLIRLRDTYLQLTGTQLYYLRSTT